MYRSDKRDCSDNYVDITSENVSPGTFNAELGASISPYIESRTITVQYIKRKSSGKLRGKFQELRKWYWGQHLWVRGYFVVTSGQINSKDVQE